MKRTLVAGIFVLAAAAIIALLAAAGGHDGQAGRSYVEIGGSIHTFWMKNTLIPLDMVFIGANGTVVDVLHATPCEKEPCEIYSPKGKALYVLEVAGGTFDEGIIGERAAIAVS